MTATSETGPAIALLSPALGTGNVGDHFIEAAVRRLLRADVVYQRFSTRQPLTGRDIDAINRTTCALLCGTNLYQRDWESALSPEILAGIRVPVVPFGVGSSAATLGDYEVSRTTRQMIRALHACCPVGSVRDPHSAEVVARAGVANVLLTGCPVLFWGQRDHLSPVRPAKRRRIVVTARNWLMHHWPDNVDHPLQVALLRTLLDSFPGEQLVFAIHEDFDARLVDLLNIPRRLVFQSQRPADYLRLYTDEENVILALRLHAGMLGLANGVPAVFVAHDTRTRSFCDMMGLDYYELFAETCAEDCRARLQQILDGDVTSFLRTGACFQPLGAAMRQFLAANQLPVASPGEWK